MYLGPGSGVTVINGMEQDFRPFRPTQFWKYQTKMCRNLLTKSHFAFSCPWCYHFMPCFNVLKNICSSNKKFGYFQWNHLSNYANIWFYSSDFFRRCLNKQKPPLQCNFVRAGYALYRKIDMRGPGRGKHVLVSFQWKYDRYMHGPCAWKHWI